MQIVWDSTYCCLLDHRSFALVSLATSLKSTFRHECMTATKFSQFNCPVIVVALLTKYGRQVVRIANYLYRSKKKDPEIKIDSFTTN